MGLFSKKVCSICGGQIGLLGNRKLEDGNLCKECAAKLSPWFSERRSSTVAQIQEQLEYREANREAVAAFHTTRSLGGDNTKLLVDEDAGKFVVTRARDLQAANPDVVDFSQVTGVDFDIDEDRDEEKRKDSEGKMVSYAPPRYKYSYDFKIQIRVNHSWFDSIKFQLNPSGVSTTPEAVIEARKPDPKTHQDYQEYVRMGSEIKTLLMRGRQQARTEAQQAAKPKTAVTCPHCGATTFPDVNGCCEYCGGAGL